MVGTLDRLRLHSSPSSRYDGGSPPPRGGDHALPAAAAHHYEQNDAQALRMFHEALTLQQLGLFVHHRLLVLVF